MKQKIGLFGGTFNPIHIGHLINAEFILNEFNLDKIIFVPAFIPPLKKDYNLNYLNHRIKMVKLAIKNNKNFEFSDFEIKKEEVSYTIHTIKHFHTLGYEVFLILGDEWLNKFNLWHNYKEIFKYARLIVMRRKFKNSKIPKFLLKYKNKIKFSLNPIIEISSTIIRERIKNGLSIKYMVPDRVYKYIIKNNLYKK